MEILKNIVRPLRSLRWPGIVFLKKSKILTPEETLAVKLRPYQQYLYKLQALLLWKEPFDSILFVVAVNAFFVLLSWTKWRFYGVVLWTLLALILHDAWVNSIWPEIRANDPPVTATRESLAATEHPTPEGMLSVPELSKCATCVHSITTDVFINLKSLRSHHPFLFCFSMASLVLVVAKVGSAVSGFWLLYMLVMFAILGPGVIFNFVPPKAKEYLAGVFSHLASVIRTTDKELGVEEYLPEQNKENITLFNLASGESLDKTNVSTPSSDMDVLPMEPIPSHDESSLDRDSSFGLDTRALESASRFAESSLSFTPTHFNGSTLSAALRQALTDTLGPNLIGAVLAPPQLDHNSDSDSSEFELIEPEDSPPT